MIRSIDDARALRCDHCGRSTILLILRCGHDATTDEGEPGDWTEETARYQCRKCDDEAETFVPEDVQRLRDKDDFDRADWQAELRDMAEIGGRG